MRQVFSSISQRHHDFRSLLHGECSGSSVFEDVEDDGMGKKVTLLSDKTTNTKYAMTSVEIIKKILPKFLTLTFDQIFSLIHISARMKGTGPNSVADIILRTRRREGIKKICSICEFETN